jgi:hypothetical protein
MLSNPPSPSNISVQRVADVCGLLKTRIGSRMATTHGVIETLLPMVMIKIGIRPRSPISISFMVKEICCPSAKVVIFSGVFPGMKAATVVT